MTKTPDRRRFRDLELDPEETFEKRYRKLSRLYDRAIQSLETKDADFAKLRKGYEQEIERLSEDNIAWRTYSRRKMGEDHSAQAMSFSFILGAVTPLAIAGLIGLVVSFFR